MSPRTFLFLLSLALAFAASACFSQGFQYSIVYKPDSLISSKALEQEPTPLSTTMPKISKPSGVSARNGTTVLVSALLGLNGVPQNARIVRSDNDSLNAPAQNAVLQWRFTPALSQGKPVFCNADITFRFDSTLASEKPPADLSSYSPPERSFDMVPQKTSSSGNSLKVYIGGTFPTGDFNSTSAREAGFATMGYLGSLEYGFDFLREGGVGISAGVSASYGANAFDATALEKLIQDYLLVTDLQVQAGSWKTIALLASLGFERYTEDGPGIYGKAYAGRLFETAPEIITSSVFRGFTVDQGSSTASAPCYGLAVGFMFGRVDFGVMFIQAEPELQILVTTPQGPVTETYRQPVSVIGVRAGYAIF